MLLSKMNMLVGKAAASKSPVRALNYLRIEDDGATAASNGAALVVAEPDPAAERGVVLPLKRGDGAGVPVGEGGALVPPSLAQEVVRAMPRGGGAKGRLLERCALVERNEESGLVGFAVTDLVREQVVRGQALSGGFPDIGEIFRGLAARPASRVCLNRKTLKALLDLMDSACPGDVDAPVFVEIPADGRGEVLLRSANIQTGQHIIGILAQVNTGGRWLEMSRWEKKKAGLLRNARRPLPSTK